MKKIFKGKLLTLYVKKQRFPNSHIANLEIVKHPGAVLIVPFLNNDTLVLIRQYRPVINRYMWELPAGTLHKKEQPLNCAKRELIEEIGYKAERWRKIGYIYPAPGYTTEKILIFEAYGLKKVKSSRQEDEIITVNTFTKSRIIGLFNTGKITDAKTICALKLAQIL